MRHFLLFLSVCFIVTPCLSVASSSLNCQSINIDGDEYIYCDSNGALYSKQAVSSNNAASNRNSGSVEEASSKSLVVEDRSMCRKVVIEGHGYIYCAATDSLYSKAKVTTARLNAIKSKLNALRKRNSSKASASPVAPASSVISE